MDPRQQALHDCTIVRNMNPDEAASHAGPHRDPLLASLARRVRDARERRGWNRAELARRSGLSVRFLARIESGDGNVSVLRLAALADALDSTPDVLLRPALAPAPTVTLVGLRGAGKSTVGPRLAERLGRRFVEMDELILEASGLSLDELFELHGERYYRRLERETLQRALSAGDSAVIAAAGGIVNAPDSWGLVREHTTVVWLRARPEDHWDRVVAQGDRRPMRDNPEAMAELRALLASREAVYRQADLTVDTADTSPDDVVETIVERLAVADLRG